MKRKNRDTPGKRIACYLGYEPNFREEKETTNRRNGYFDKSVKTSMWETESEVPRARQTFFESIILPKHKRNLYWQCRRDISATQDDIYGFKLSAEQISKNTD